MAFSPLIDKLKWSNFRNIASSGQWCVTDFLHPGEKLVNYDAMLRKSDNLSLFIRGEKAILLVSTYNVLHNYSIS